MPGALRSDVMIPRTKSFHGRRSVSGSGRDNLSTVMLRPGESRASSRTSRAPRSPYESTFESSLLDGVVSCDVGPKRTSEARDVCGKRDAVRLEREYDGDWRSDDSDFVRRAKASVTPTRTGQPPFRDLEFQKAELTFEHSCYPTIESVHSTFRL